MPHYMIGSPLTRPEHRLAERALIERSWASLLASRRPDVVFLGRETHAWHGVPLARSAGVPTVLRLAGGGMHHLMTGRMPPAESQHLLEELSRVDLLIAPARHLADSARALGLARVTTITNAIDVDQFSPGPKDGGLLRSLGLDAGDVVVVHASNLKPVKKPLTIVRAASIALKKCSRLAFLIVGDGPGRAIMEETCLRLGVGDRFRFAGWIPYGEMARYITLADMVVMPSASEGMARVYMEAQACERVLVASNIPAAREVIRDGDTGLLFRLEDPDDLAAKVVWAADHPHHRAEIGRRAREQAVRWYSLGGAVKSYLTVLRDVGRTGKGRTSSVGVTNVSI